MALRTKVATLSLALLGFPTAATASAQTIGQAIANALNNKSQMIRQQTDTAVPKAKTAPRAAAETSSVKAQQPPRAGVAHASSRRSLVASNSNDFALLTVPTYRLPSGLSLQFSGAFSPGKGVTCTANCPVALSTKR